MKKIQILLGFLILSVLVGCTKDGSEVNLDALVAPKNIAALVTIKNDNSGKVTLLPSGEGVTQFEVYFGDGTAQPAFLIPGETVNHTYIEGVFNARIIAMTLNGLKTEITKVVTVTFLPPSDLVTAITHSDARNATANVSATANLETYFEVYFGDVTNEIPIQFNEGDQIAHNYNSVGTYTIRVVARTGGAASIEHSEPFVVTTIASLPVLPLDFESSSITYTFVDFGGSVASVVSNPAPAGINTSSNVGKTVKGAPQTWAGSSILLSNPINFSSLQKIKIKVWSPAAGRVVKLKLEKINAANPDPTNIEKDATTTKVNEWEELTFDFAGIVNANNYQRVVLFFNFGVPGTGESYYFDDIRQSN